MVKRGWALFGATVFAALTLSACGAAKYEAKTGGGEEIMQKVKEGKPIYTPPAEAMPRNK